MSGGRRFAKRWFRDAMVLVAIAATIVAAITGLARWNSKDMSQRYIRDAAQRAATGFQQMARRVEDALIAARNYGLDPDKIDIAKHYLLTTMFPSFRELSGVALAEKGGNVFYLSRDGVLKDIGAEGGYDPETRPWFKQAPETGECYWSDIYRFHSLNTLGISVSVRRKDRPSVVIAFDIPLDAFFAAVDRLAPSPSGKAFIFQPNGKLYVPDNENMKLHFLSVAASNDLLASKGLAAWNDQSLWDDGSNWMDMPDMNFTTTHVGKKLWWCGFIPLEKSRRMVWLCVMVPESDIVGNPVKRRMIYASVGSIVFMAAATLYLFAVRRRNSVVLDTLISAEEVRALIEKGENREVEFKSTMRMNLHRGKPGKEIELAWLKGVAAFMNTDGGIILLGVADEGTITGLEQDVFENDDKCRLHFKNLIATHLGADTSKFVRFSLIPLDGKTVGLVQCAHAARPVYLRDGNKETFYIRNGPSSDELPASKMVDYIAENWR